MKKVMVIGSGPIVIGQAAEFDYAGTQACRALKEEGFEVVLINSNPATIMTDDEIADRVYIEPLTVEFCERVIAQEKPDGLLPSLGGQTGLNLATQLNEHGILEKYNVKLLGTPLTAIKMAEDREEFRELMRRIREPVPESWIVNNESELTEVSEIAPYPCIIRPAYTLGGTGGGVAYTKEELLEIGKLGLSLSMKSQILVERSLLGWKEVEYEVMRDSADNCITICNMENFDPMGVHTGDSIVVAPSQTLSDIEYHILRSASLKIIRALGVEGGCNVQLAVNPESFDYYVIEVNPRVSRSSALASKATGFPIARVSAKVAVGKTLDEIENPVTKTTKACFEPALDYCVVKIPRWPFDKFSTGDRTLSTQMKATGEVMAIDRNFEYALMKAVRGLEIGIKDLNHPKFKTMDDKQLKQHIAMPTDERLWAIAEGLRRQWRIDELNKLSKIDKWFLTKIQKVIQNTENQNSNGYKMVDTCAGEFESRTPYYYSTSEKENDTVESRNQNSVLVLGSGPIRIGQGIEFDYSCVHCAWALSEMGHRSVILNNNPETVSTDFDTGDALYFDPITVEDVIRIIERENAIGVMLQFGGQTSINLADELKEKDVNILGTDHSAIRKAEDRDEFEKMLSKLKIPKPPGRGVTTILDAISVAREVGYPVVVRPSFVLGGRAMQIVWNDNELENYMVNAAQVSDRAPVLVDKYLNGMETEVDVISDGVDTLIPGLMEHIERAGVHSGDSMSVYPPVNVPVELQKQMIKYACDIARELKIKGLMNIQFVLIDDTVYVLEVNPRASRTVPYLSKVTGLPMVKIATRCAMGESLKQQGYESGIWDPINKTVSKFGIHENINTPPDSTLFAVKAPVFSFQKLVRVEPTLGPEMKSTGEVMGIDVEYPSALYKAMIASGMRFPTQGTALLTVRDEDKKEVIPIALQLRELGFDLAATSGTHEFLSNAGIPSKKILKISESEDNILKFTRSGKVVLLVNTPSQNTEAEEEAYAIRRACIEMGIPCLTSLDTVKALIISMKAKNKPEKIQCRTVADYLRPLALT